MRWLVLLLSLGVVVACGGTRGTNGGTAACDPYCLDAPDGGSNGSPDGGWWTAPPDPSLPPLPAEPNQGDFTGVGAADGLDASTIRMVDVGPDGTVWVATDSGLFARLPGRSFKGVTTADGLGSNDVASVAAAGTGTAYVGFDGPQGDLLAGAVPTGSPGTGLVSTPRLGPQAALVTVGPGGASVQPILLDQSGFTQSIFAVAPDPAQPGAAWFAGDGGLFERLADGTVLGPRHPPVLAGWAFGLAVSSTDQIWDGDDTQCSRLDLGAGFWSPFAEVIDVWPGVRDRTSRLRLSADGTLYIGSWANGLAIRSPQGALSYLSTDQGAPSNWVSSILPDPDGTLWVGTLRGLGRWDPASGTWRYYTTASGLPADIVWSMALERTGAGRTLWIGTTGGVARFTGK